MAGYKVMSIVCPVQVACDGTEIKAGKAMCAICRDKLAKQKKDKTQPVKLKGAAK